MPEKIARDICLIKFRQFPLREYSKDEEISFYPKIHSHFWVELKNKPSAEFSKALARELIGLLKNLNVENLVFFGDSNRPWISKFTEERKDNRALIESVNYFKKSKIANRFNGAVKVKISELEEFVEHFYVLTMCDGEFVYYHFTDEKENLLGFIHYSGEVQLMVLNKATEKTLKEEVDKTKFVVKE